MPLQGEKKPLHLAKSIRGLNELANTPTGHTNLRLLAKSTQILLKNASESYLEGDQEKAYVLYMRFFNVVTCIKKSKEYNKDKSYYDMLIGDKNCKMAIERAEQLSESLNLRYDELLALEICKKTPPIALKGSKDEDENEVRIDGLNDKIQKASLTVIDKTSPTGWISVQKLYEWFRNDDISILLVDVRSKEEFDSSHITSFNDIINTPDILPGMTAKNVEVGLTGSALLCWGHRGDYEVIVICDLATNSKTFNENICSMAHLKAALVFWDLEAKLKNEPLFLLGGYREWAETYPMFVSKPLPRDELRPSSSTRHKTDVKAILDSIDYDIDLTYLTTPTLPPTTNHNSAELSCSGTSIPLIDRSKKPRNNAQFAWARNSAQPRFLPANGSSTAVQSPKGNVNPTTLLDRKLKPNAAPSKETPPPTSSPPPSETNLSLSNGKIDQFNGCNTLTDNRPSKPHQEGETPKREIEELEKKRKLEIDISNTDKQKTMTEVDGGFTLSQEKAKQARELAGLLREKRKLAQELNDMSKQVQLQRAQIMNGKNEIVYVNENRDNSFLKAGDIDSPGTIISDDQQTFLPPAVANDRSSSPSDTVIHIKTTLPGQVGQPVTVSDVNLSPKTPSKTQEPPPKTSLRTSREPHMKSSALQPPSSSPRSSPKRLTVRLQDPDVAPKPSSGDDTMKSNLKRFHSFPNIAKLVEEGNDDDVMVSDAGSKRPEMEKSQQAKDIQIQRSQVQPPRVDRSVKPTNSYKSLLEAKVRNFQPKWGSIGLGLTGLRNLGNTCYMNSIIQCLSNCLTFCMYFKDNHYSKDINWSNQDGFRGEVAIEFAALIKNIWSGQYKAISPIDFRAVVSKLGSMFASTQHQDAQELLDFLMNGLNEDLNRVSVKPQLPPQDNSKLEDEVAAERAWKNFLMVENSIVIDLFRGQYKSRVMCSYCETKSTVFEPFTSLTLQIPENQSKCSLSDCLLHFSNEEKMTGDSRWFCPRCKQKREATKRIVVWRLPQVLIIHLKRFHYQGIWRNKISTNVSFPLVNLDMSRYLSGPRSCDGNINTTYNLFAVCNHYGTLDGGHYTAYCKNMASRSWYKFDDCEVSEISPSSIQSPAAYLLFYAKAGSWPQ